VIEDLKLENLTLENVKLDRIAPERYRSIASQLDHLTAFSDVPAAAHE
jgi:hypothetical protein